jgi:hypothetical protein
MTLHLHHVPADVATYTKADISGARHLSVVRLPSGDLSLAIWRNGNHPETFPLTNADAQALIDALHSVRGGRHG